MLQDLSGMNQKSISLMIRSDEKSLVGLKVLGVTPEQIDSNTGTQDSRIWGRNSFVEC